MTMDRQEIKKAIALYRDLKLLRLELKLIRDKDTKEAVISSWTKKNIPEAYIDFFD